MDRAGIQIVRSEWINVAMLFSESGQDMSLVNVWIRGIMASRCLEMRDVLVMVMANCVDKPFKTVIVMVKEYIALIVMPEDDLLMVMIVR